MENTNNEVSEEIESVAEADQADSLTQSGTAPAKKKTLTIIVCVVSVLVAAAVVLFILLSGSSIQKLMKSGDYGKAFNEAEKHEKLSIAKEYFVALTSQLTISKAKYTSFKLIDAWAKEKSITHTIDYIVLYTEGTTSSGRVLTSYWYWNRSNNEWTYQNYDDLIKDELPDGASDARAATLLIKNIMLENNVVPMVSNYSLKLSSESIDRINYLYEKDGLSNIKFVAAYNLDLSIR